MTERPQHRWYLVSLGWFWTAMVLPIPEKTDVVGGLATCSLPRAESGRVPTSAHGEGCIPIMSPYDYRLAAYQNMVHYNAAKHGVVGIMRTLANELGNHTIRVNSIHPAFTDAEIVMNQPTYDLF
ncbi:NAD(P)-dependent dehydrogenase (short-subunit alcohol dehydrogenase family) [Rhodococcus sp. OAS809]